jgi:hypothetical protein
MRLSKSILRPNLFSKLYFSLPQIEIGELGRNMVRDIVSMGWLVASDRLTHALLFIIRRFYCYGPNQ